MVRSQLVFLASVVSVLPACALVVRERRAPPPRTAWTAPPCVRPPAPAVVGFSYVHHEPAWQRPPIEIEESRADVSVIYERTVARPAPPPCPPTRTVFVAALPACPPPRPVCVPPPPACPSPGVTIFSSRTSRTGGSWEREQRAREWQARNPAPQAPPPAALPVSAPSPAQRRDEGGKWGVHDPSAGRPPQGPPPADRGLHGNNGVGNGPDAQPPGNPSVNDGPGAGPGNPGNRGGRGHDRKR